MTVGSRRLVLSLTVAAFAWAGSSFREAEARGPVLQTERTVWDGVYSLSQTERGQALFESECTRCHEATDFVGEEFMATWEGQTLKEFYLYVSSGMPPDLHEEITDFGAYADILAYILRSNGLPAGDTDLSSNLDRLDLIRVEPMP